MKIHDISVPLSAATQVWPGDPPVRMERVLSMERGDPCNVSAFSLGAHSGTHIDAPLHFIREGKTVDALPLDLLMGPCTVIDIKADSLIRKRDLEGQGIERGARVLLKTKNSGSLKNGAGFREDFIALGLEAAGFLVEKKIALVGIDYLSIESFNAGEEHPVHRVLLTNGIIILEGLDLSGVAPGSYELVCLPLRATGVEGEPARAVLLEQ
jgi:arylformamidase